MKDKILKLEEVDDRSNLMQICRCADKLIENRSKCALRDGSHGSRMGMKMNNTLKCKKTVQVWTVREGHVLHIQRPCKCIYRPVGLLPAESH
jgi:hypothetical protein